MTLDFASGLIQHATTVDDDGIEWPDHAVQRLEGATCSSAGIFSLSHSLSI